MQYKDDANFTKCSWGFNMGICTFAPHISKKLGQLCSLTQEQGLVQSTTIGLMGANEGSVGGVTPPIISTPRPSCNLMGRSRSRSVSVCIEFLFITPLADSSSVGAVIYYSKAALTFS